MCARARARLCVCVSITIMYSWLRAVASQVKQKVLPSKPQYIGIQSYSFGKICLETRLFSAPFLIAIMLGSLKLPFDDIRASLLRCDGALEPESIQSLLKYLPPADKVGVLLVFLLLYNTLSVVHCVFQGWVHCSLL